MSSTSPNYYEAATFVSGWQKQHGIKLTNEQANDLTCKIANVVHVNRETAVWDSPAISVRVIEMLSKDAVDSVAHALTQGKLSNERSKAAYEAASSRSDCIPRKALALIKRSDLG